MLPKQTLPIYEMKIPSTGKTTKYRQFTVREEKMLMQAKTSDDAKVIVNAIKEIIKACAPDIKNIDDLAVFDMEYIMTKIRSKSVGEVVDLKMPCDADASHEATPVRINLDKIEVRFPEGHSKTIPLYGDVGIAMRYPTVGTLHLLEGVTGIDAIIQCIDYIYDADQVYPSADQTKQEMLTFLEDLTEEQVKKIESIFFEKIPVFEYVFEYKCNTCGHNHKRIIKGLSNFFV